MDRKNIRQLQRLKPKDFRTAIEEIQTDAYKQGFIIGSVDKEVDIMALLLQTLEDTKGIGETLKYRVAKNFKERLNED